MKCPKGQHCVIQQCECCKIYLNTCHEHGRRYCDRCSEYKCRVKDCHRLMNVCERCQVILPVCGEHGNFCRECHISKLYYPFIASITSGKGVVSVTLIYMVYLLEHATPRKINACLRGGLIVFRVLKS